jgi:hypothetical protein
MIRTAFISLGALTLVSAARAPLRAQGSGQSIQLAFGYECGDRFMVRNDGNNPVVVEYAVAGSEDKSQLHLNGLQSAEIASAQSGNLELWVNGKVVASEPKGNRACGAAQGNGVNVQALNQDAETSAAPADSGYSAPPVVVYAQPGSYYGDDYYPYYPYSPYAYYGYSPFLYPSIGFYGGFGRGYGYGGGIRGGGVRGGGVRGGGGFRGPVGRGGGRGGRR